ncbi:hypothetical protein [Streptomyces sp. NPDC058657]
MMTRSRCTPLASERGTRIEPLLPWAEGRAAGGFLDLLAGGR